MTPPSDPPSNLSKSADACSVLESAPLPILSMDLERRVTFWNAAAEQLFGWTAEEVIGEPLPIVPNEEETAFDAFWNEITSNKAFSGYEAIRQHRDGTLISVSISAGPLLSDEGRIQGVFAFLEDITKRKQNEDALRRHEAFLSMAAKLSHVGAWSVDIPSMQHAWTDEARRIHGVDEGVYPNVDALISFYEQPYQQQIRTAFEACVRDGTPFDIRAEFVAADGVRKWVRAVGEAVRNARGSIIRVQGAIQDISGTVEADRALQESESRYRSLFENSHTVMLLIDAQTAEIVHANPAASTFYGWTLDELRGKPIHEINTMSRAEVRAEIARAAKRTRNEFRFKHRIKNGELRDVEVFSGPIERGGQTLIYTLVHDVTEKRQIESRLELQSAALNAAANSIVITNRDGVIEWANQAFYDLSGYEPEEAAGRTPGELIKSGVQPSTFYEKMWEVMISGEVWSGEVVNRRKDGSTYTEELTITPMKSPDGEITHFVGVKQDVSERKNLEQQFLRAQRVESIGILAGGVAHDLNNVLTPIMLAIDALRMNEADERKRAMLESMDASAKRGANLVRQVLAFSRGSVDAPSELNLRHVLTDMQRLMNETFPLDITVETHVPSDLWDITADPTQMHQVLMNLCINARDAMPDGGKLMISLQNEHLKTHFTRGDVTAHSGPHVLLTVKDSGTGIEQDILDSIFDPFFTSKEPGEGTGLGLATVQSIVRAHGGFVDVASKPGKGAEFRVYLPAIDPDERASDATRRHARSTSDGTISTLSDAKSSEANPSMTDPRETSDGPSRTVLVVDDEPAIRLVAAAALQHVGFQTLEAEHGEQAMEIWNTHGERIDAVLLDSAMPIMDGLATTHALRKAGAAVPIVMSSGYLTDDKEKEVWQAGINALLPKPYAGKDLAATIRELL